MRMAFLDSLKVFLRTLLKSCDVKTWIQKRTVFMWKYEKFMWKYEIWWIHGLAFSTDMCSTASWTWDPLLWILSQCSECWLKINLGVFLGASLKWTYSNHCFILIGKKSGGVKSSSGNEHLKFSAPWRLGLQLLQDLKSPKESVFSCYDRIFYAHKREINFCSKVGFECVFSWYHIRNSATYIAVYLLWLSSFQLRKTWVLMRNIPHSIF